MSVYSCLRGFGYAAAAVGLLAASAEPAMADVGGGLPAPGVGILAGGAIVGGLLIAKFWRR